MVEIENYSIKEFLSQPYEVMEEYARLLKHLDPIKTKHELKSLTFDNVETIKKTIENQDALPEIFQLMDGLEKEQFENLTVTEFYAKMNYIINQLEHLYKMEEHHLTSQHSDFKWEAVEGSKRLAKFGVLPLVDNLAGGDILKYNAILDLPYMTVFNKLRMDVTVKDIQKDMEKIKTQKS